MSGVYSPLPPQMNFANNNRAVSPIPYLLLVPISLIGCHKAATDPTDITILARPPRTTADLSKPFNAVVWGQTGAKLDPLSVAYQLAVSAGGDWIAVLPRPRDKVKWRPPFASGGRGTIIIPQEGAQDANPRAVSSCIKAINKSGTPVAVENVAGRMTLYF